MITVLCIDSQLLLITPTRSLHFFLTQLEQQLQVQHCSIVQMNLRLRSETCDLHIIVITE
jgi:hypothetical protein